MSASKLATAFQMGGQIIKNRVALAPLTRGRSGKDYVPNSANAEYYAQRASGGLLISEGTLTSKQACGWAGAPGIYNDAQINGWKNVTSKVHEAGGIIYMQL
jgi:N-ethylmaleimide reductase